MAEQPKPTLRQRMAAKLGEKAVHHWHISSWADPSITGPLSSGGLAGGQAGQMFGPAKVAIACGQYYSGQMATDRPHLVTCPECIQHPKFVELYDPGPKVERYEDIPAEHRRVIEAAEQIGGK